MRARGAALCVLLLLPLIGLPRPCHAGFWSSATAAAYGLDAELSELRAQRELMTHRRAQRAALQGSVGALSREIGALRRRAERAHAAIAAQHDAARSQEEALDRIVPRLLARAESLERRRAQAARALADLASLSRRRELAPELRARLSAIGPALLALVRSRDSTRAALSKQHDRLALQQRLRTARMPILRAEATRAQQERQALVDQRRHVLQEIATIDTGLQRLARASGPVARRLMVIEAARGARAEPHAARPARDRRSIRMASAVRGRALRVHNLVQAAPPGRARAIAAAPTREGLERHPLLEPNLAVRMASLPQGRPLAAGRIEVRAPVAQPMVVASLPSRAAPARLALPAPIRPSPATVAWRGDSGNLTGTMIAAAPGQRVAAPQDGRIVFADAFKSYGLLLIIEHDSEYHTLLWGFSKLRVAVGDKVTDGEIIGVMDMVDGVEPQLGVELRRRGRPVNPLPWLAASSSKVRG